MKLSFPVNPVLPSPEAGWEATSFCSASAIEATSWGFLCSGLEGAACTAPWDVPFRVGDDFVPGGLSRAFLFWRNMLLVELPNRATILPWVRDCVSFYGFLLSCARGVSAEQPFNPAAFPGEEIPNRIPEEFHGFVAGKIATLVRRGCCVLFEEARMIDGPCQPRVAMPLNVEPPNRVSSTTRVG